MLGKPRENSAEAWLLQALRRDDDRATRAWLGDMVGRSHIRRAVSMLTRDEALSLVSRGGSARIAALSEHPDGRVREAAIRALQPDQESSLLALLKRANDWVPIVAQLAGEQARAALPRADDRTLLAALPHVYALTEQRRVRHGDLARAYLDEVGRRQGLAGRIRRANRNGPTGRWASSHVLGSGESLDSIAQESLRMGQPSVQIKAAKRLVAEPGMAPTLMASRNPQVRRLALDRLSEDGLKVALTDLHAGVRNDARFLLGRRDYAAWYRERLPQPGAVSGLGECGKPEDADSIRPCLDDPRAEVRARAVDALARLLDDTAAPTLRRALNDPRRRVQKAAVEALLRMNVVIDAQEALDMDLPASLRLRLLSKAPRWSGLAAVLQRVREMPEAEAWLERWIRQSWQGRLGPKPAELSAAQATLAAAPGALPPRLEQELRRIFRERV